MSSDVDTVSYYACIMRSIGLDPNMAKHNSINYFLVAAGARRSYLFESGFDLDKFSLEEAFSHLPHLGLKVVNYEPHNYYIAKGHLEKGELLDIPVRDPFFNNGEKSEIWKIEEEAEREKYVIMTFLLRPNHRDPSLAQRVAALVRRYKQALPSFAISVTLY